MIGKKIHCHQRLKNFLIAMVLISSLLVTSCAKRLSNEKTEAAEVVEPYAFQQMYYYPNLGQSEDVQDRDLYECYLWAVEQSGFDPSSTELAPHQRIVVKTQPTGAASTFIGAASGAILGAAVGAPRHRAGTAVIGAAVGAIIGAASDAAVNEQADSLQENYDRQAASRAAILERQAGNYRRALQACMTGRGYSAQ